MKKNDHKIIGVDFDNTLALTRGTYPEIQEPIQDIIDYIKDEQRLGSYLILVTMREGKELDDAIAWCKERGIEFDAVNDNLPHMQEFFNNNPRKIFCNEYIDDTNMGGLDYIRQEIAKVQEGRGTDVKFCFGTVCWGGYLERYIDIFVNNYITLFRKLISLGVNYNDIPDPRVVYNNDAPGAAVGNAAQKLALATGKDLVLICDRHKYTTEQVMYSTRNRLRAEYRKAFPLDRKVFWYFPIDDNIRSESVIELMKLSKSTEPMACMFKFLVDEGTTNYTAATRPICSYKDIHPSDWGGYCAYNILDEDKCPLYPEIAIPNVAFYAELYKAGYKEYQSKEIGVDHLRHKDSHHFKYKDTTMSKEVKDFLMKQRIELYEGGYK